MSIDHFIDRKASHINSLSIHQLPEVVGGGRLKFTKISQSPTIMKGSPIIHLQN